MFRIFCLLFWIASPSKEGSALKGKNLCPRASFLQDIEGSPWLSSLRSRRQITWVAGSSPAWDEIQVEPKHLNGPS